MSAPVVLASVKPGAGSPTSTARAGREVPRTEEITSAVANRTQLRIRLLATVMYFLLAPR
jgi:hypothetical protein